MCSGGYGGEGGDELSGWFGVLRRLEENSVYVLIGIIL